MRKYITLFCFILSAFCLSAQNNLSALIPMPNQYKIGQGKSFAVNNLTKIYTSNKQLDFTASLLQQVFKKRMNIQLPVTHSPSADATIRLIIDPTIKGNETYKLTVTAHGLTIYGSSSIAIQDGIMTTDQLLLGDAFASSRHQIAPITISDKPRFARRILMLDPARHFLSVKDIKFYIDQMIKYKFNALQLHLTDDQGWRVEIKGYPKLTAGGPFYTQEELKDLCNYAALRNVEIIPELDVPGHTVSILSAYPELACTVNDTIPKIIGTTTDMMLCCSQQEVYSFYKVIISQVCALFPSPYIHLGGDEAAISKNWAKCERCQALMKEKGYSNPAQLMIPFFDKILSYVRDAGKKAILWCELNNIYAPADDYLFPYPKDVMLVSWRNGLTPTCIDITKRYGNTLILAPGEYAYFDYPQMKGDLPEYNNWGMPITTLKKSYEFDPGYGLPADRYNHVDGVMGTLWGEAIIDINRALYMTYPRAFALSEAGWTDMEHRNWNSFRQRLYPNLLDLIKCGVSVRAPFEIAKDN